MADILILNGPNLNMLGVREPHIYGTTTLKDIHLLCDKTAKAFDLEIDFRQSNHEGELVTWIQEARGVIRGLVINAAAYTHTSIAIHDALKLLDVPVIEVHLSNPAARESFRHISFVAPVAAKIIAGQGAPGYALAIEHLAGILE